MGFIYDSAKAEMNLANWAAYDVRAMLVGPTYVPSLAHVVVSQVVGELTAHSYGRKPITGRSGAVDPTNGVVSYTANNPVWPMLDGQEQIKYVVFFNNFINDRSSPLLYCLELTHVAVSAGDDFLVRFNYGVSSGVVFQVQVVAAPSTAANARRNVQ